MARARCFGPLLLASLWVSGCASPEGMSGLGARIAGAFPGLSYVNGDPAAGTTTLASLPLLSYRTTEEHPGYFDSETFVLPLLGRFAQTDRYVRLTWPGQGEEAQGEGAQGQGSQGEDAQGAEAGAKAQGPPPDWWDRRRGGSPTRRSKPARSRGAEGEATRADAPAPERAPAQVEGAPAEVEGPRSSAEGERPDLASQKDYLVLRLSGPTKIVQQLPYQNTQWDILLGLIGHHAERPARVVVRPTSKLVSKAERRRGRVVYEVGPTSDCFRLLPLLSYRRGAEGSQFMLWPLLFGYEREGKERYLRVFYFLKVPLED